MRVAITGPYFRPQLSGIEKIMDMHARLLSASGHEVGVFTSNLRFPEGRFDVPETETIDGVRVHRLPVLLRRPPAPFSYPSNGGIAIRGLGRALAAFRPDIVHAHNIGAPAWAHGSARHARRAGVPFFYSSYHHPDHLKLDALRKSALRLLNRLPLHQAERVYHLTRSDFPKLLADYPRAQVDRFAVLPPGVSPPILGLDQADEHNALLFVGRVDDERKGFSVLEEAYAQLVARRPHLPRLVVAGAIDGTTRERLQARFGSAIEIAGIVSEPELERLYATAALFVMPSFYEGFGMPYIEAMRYGVPVIGTRVGGVPEVVPDRCGVLIEAGDVPALATAIEGLLDQPERAAAMGQAGRVWSQNFWWPHVIDQLEADYQRALSNRI